MTISVEAGACGEDLEERLNTKGLCIGHEPDSYEFRCVVSCYINSKTQSESQDSFCMVVTPWGLCIPK